jgi:SNF2 family DNA or RNA helicase
MVQMVYGLPEGFKDKVLAVLTDSSTELRSRLGVLGFNFNPLGRFWTRKDFQPHVVSTLRSFGVEPSEAVLEEYKEQTCFRPMRVFEDNFKYEMLLPYQEEALNFTKNAKSCVIALSIGLGKTIVAIGYADFLGQKNLIVCPASLRSQWNSELAKFNNKEPSRIVIEGNRTKRKNQWELAQDCQYVVCSYDLLRQEEDLIQAKKYLSGGLLICDEIMRAKTSSSLRAKAVKDLRSSAYCCIGLTGTLIDNHLGEFYTILNLVSPNFMPSYERFAETFLVREQKFGMHGKNYWIIHGTKNIDEFRNLIKPLVIRKEKRECLVLPPASTIIRNIEMSKEQKRIEKRLLELAKDDPDNILRYFTYARENTISPDLIPKVFDQPTSKGLDLWASVLGDDLGVIDSAPSRVKQLIEGRIKPDEIVLTPRLEEIRILIEESGSEKLIIFSTYVKALELIKRCILEEPCAMVIGGCSVEKEISKFRNDHRILLLSEAGIEGLNLQFTKNLVITNSAWTMSRMDQLRGRIERSGQIHPMTFYELRSPSIVESRILKILERKEKLSERVLAKEVMGVI